MGLSLLLPTGGRSAGAGLSMGAWPRGRGRELRLWAQEGPYGPLPDSRRLSPLRLRRRSFPNPDLFPQLPPPPRPPPQASSPRMKAPANVTTGTLTFAPWTLSSDWLGGGAHREVGFSDWLSLGSEGVGAAWGLPAIGGGSLRIDPHASHFLNVTSRPNAVSKLAGPASSGLGGATAMTGSTLFSFFPALSLWLRPRSLTLPR